MLDDLTEQWEVWPKVGWHCKLRLTGLTRILTLLNVFVETHNLRLSTQRALETDAETYRRTTIVVFSPDMLKRDPKLEFD